MSVTICGEDRARLKIMGDVEAELSVPEDSDGRCWISVSDGTLIEEGGWRETPTGLKASYGNCMGWSQMLCALKAWIEHGINLRDGMYV